MKAMLIAVVLILQLSSLIADDSPSWICSDKIKMDFINKTAINENGIWIHAGEVRADLTFDIDEIDSIFVFPIKYNNKSKQNQCEHKTISKTARFYLKFSRPFNDHRITAEVSATPKGFMIDEKVTYLFAVVKIVNGKRVFYYKNFTFNISDP